MARQNFKKPNGLKLPIGLQQELGISTDRDGYQGKKRRHAGSAVADRKEQRKATRFDKGRVQSQSRKYEGEQDAEQDVTGHARDTQARRSKKDGVSKVPKKAISIEKPAGRTPTVQPKPILKKQRARSPSIDLSESEISRASSPGLILDPNSRSFITAAKEEDENIAALERKLGSKGKKLSGSDDDFLGLGLDDSGSEGESESKKRKREGQDWLDQKRRKTSNGRALEEASDESQGEPEDGEGFDIEDTSDEENGDLLDFDEDEIDDTSGEDEASNDIFDGFESDGELEAEDLTPKRVRENPYVAPVVPGSTAKYVPPSLRRKLEGDSSGLEGLRRQVQGHLNKLSEANIISILGEIEKLYISNARQDTTTVLIDLVLASFSIRSALQNTFIILYAAFLAAVYKVMGTDFGAELLSRLVERFDKEYTSRASGKESLNLISLLANLFTFNVVSSTIVYDHIRLLLSNFNEEDAELLLRVVRDCGPQLRANDSSSLKAIVQMMREKSAEADKKGQPFNVRTQVMIKTIEDLTDNKKKTASNAVGLTGEHITRMRKALGSLNTRDLKGKKPLGMSRDDIVDSDKKGKWWLVGASWKGNEAKELEDVEPANNNQLNGYNSTPAEEDVDLLALAKQYRMNTNVRRSIFVAILSANDVRDAQTRLLKLRLSTKQEQEIAKVLLRCARAEPTYNPYYALLAKHLCKDNKKARIGFQFGLWDFFGRMGEKANEENEDDEDDNTTVEMHEIVNIAKMYAYLMFNGHLQIGILKTLNIGFLKEQATMFVEVLFISIMTQPKASEDTLIKVFGRAADTPQIVKSLQYFIKKNVRKSDLVSKKEREKVKEGCQIADIAFKMIDSAGNGLEDD